MSESSRGTAGNLLDRAYAELEFEQGRLLEAIDVPAADDADWDAIGEWLMLAYRMGAERVFFVDDDPVIIFKELSESAGEQEILEAYRSAWSLARPHCLFLSAPDGLRVYALNKPPVRSVHEAQDLGPLETVERAADVAERLSAFHRERIEAGILFEHSPFDSLDGRADSQLLRDISLANNALVDDGLPPTIAHALIERMILIRYLEDRGIVTPDYFAAIAKDEQQWRGALTSVPDTPQLGAKSAFVACLSHRAFAYSIFSQLEADFNGDLFRVEDDEYELVREHHLALIRDLLTGSGLGPQTPLFLWAYDFDVVPTSLISSMYEQFYRAGADDDQSTHYTPPELVEYVLSRVFSEEMLREQPRICDPACGSGIFLVEAFRRLVRHAAADKRRALTPLELRDLLLDRIAGVDVNPEAIRLAAFSLYLAYLNYQDPSDIQVAGPLPRLIYHPDAPDSHPVLAIGNAFSPMRDEAVDSGAADLPWDLHAFDVVVGNPPWSEPSRSAVQLGDEWVNKNSLTVGDRSPSQQFLWRCLSLLSSGGIAALLVSVKALLNSRTTSRQFRQDWLQTVELREVVDFTSAEALFFTDSSAPFALVTFQPRGPESPAGSSGMFSYCSVRPSKSLEATGALAHAQMERKWVRQEAIANREYLWRTYAWGNHHDDALMARLDLERSLSEFLPEEPAPALGYQYGESTPSDRLSSLRSLRDFDYWGPFTNSRFEDPPEGVKRQPDVRLYAGQRIVIKRGVRSGFGPVARLESAAFSFRHTIYCLPMHGVPVWKAKTILGTILSSLGRYRLFMTSGAWGVWHSDLRTRDILALPMRMAEEGSSITERIVQAVDRLAQADHPGTIHGSLAGRDTRTFPHLSDILTELDDAVFELFDTTDAERDLICDFVEHTLPLVGRRTKWSEQPGVDVGERRYGTARDFGRTSNASQLDPYLRVFLDFWNRKLEPDGELSWFTAVSPRTSFIAVVFETQEYGRAIEEAHDDEQWQSALDRLDDALAVQITKSVHMNGTLRSVGEHCIIIAKRNEARLWSPSAAREDAEAALLQAMNLQSAQ